MNKRKVLFITLYDHYAYGARCLAGACLEAGHDVAFVCLKLFLSAPLPERITDEKMRQMKEDGLQPVVCVGTTTDVLAPYPFEITESEWCAFWDTIEKFGPDVVGFSLTSVFRKLAQKISTEMRARMPKVQQVWGGIYPTLDPEGCLEWADAVCVGEGEEAFPEFLESPERMDIPNICRKNPATGEVVCNPVRPLIQDLDSLPMPMYEGQSYYVDNGGADLLMNLPPHRLYDTPIVTSTRGCPFGCTYCLHGNVRKMYSGQKYVRRKIVDRFLKDLEWLDARFPMERGFNIWDDVFLIGREWIDEFCEKYPKRFPGRPFGGYAHPSTCDRDMLEKIKRAGCECLSLGIQTGSDRLNKQVYSRHTPAADYIRMGKDLEQVGFTQLVYDVMSRCEYETEEDCRATVELLSRMPKPTVINLKHLSVYPFSLIGHLPMEKAVTPEKVFRFYELIYLLDQMPGIEPQMLPMLIESASLRENPDSVEKLLHALTPSNEVNDLKVQLAERDSRIEQLQRQMPWGIRRALNHLIGQLTNAVKSRV